MVMIAALCLAAPGALAYGTKAPKKIPIVMVGDRLVDVAYHLGVVPEVMSVRSSHWPASKELEMVSDTLMCPTRTLGDTSLLVETAKKHGITRVIAESRAGSCSANSTISMVKLEDRLKEHGMTVEFVDFSEGLEKAVQEIAAVLGVPENAASVLEEYKKKTAKAEKAMPKKPLGKKVVVLKGVYSEETGKSFLQVEAPEGYTDRFLLEPLGCENVGNRMFREGAKESHGYYTLRRLTNLGVANPDVIVMTGDSYAGQKALKEALARDPELRNVPAVRSMAVYSLPAFVNSSALGYPAILYKWIKALEM
ncbi:ABC transporter substrate-binding protein [Desulfatibacillum alkenivorans]|nr:ABC transporter substrate-binding protein [Desulfatibacillum alkenivorans]